MTAEPIRWEPSESVGAPIVDHLFARLEPHVNVGMRVDENGDWVLSFVVGVRGDTRTLPEIEDFARRCARLLELEPVMPPDEDD